LGIRRVVVTGVAAISPLGLTTAALGDALRGGVSGIRPLRSLPLNVLPVSFGGEAWDFTGAVEDYAVEDAKLKRAIKKQQKVFCREMEMGIAAAERALGDARLGPGAVDPDRIGIVYGCDYIMTLPQEFSAAIEHCRDAEGCFQFDRWDDTAIRKIDPLWLLKYLPNLPASHISILNDFRGPNNSITLREASSYLAVAESTAIIRRGDADVMIAGATGSRIHPLRTIHMALQETLARDGASPESSSRPFDRDRTGSVLGEGAGAILLETLEHAQARGATIYGEVVGTAASTVASRGLVPDRGKAIANVVRSMLRSAEMTPGDLGHLNTHGLGTIEADHQEAHGWHDALGDAAAKVPAMALKSSFGNLGAGSGLVELVASLLAFQDGTVYPTLNYRTQDPALPRLNIATGPGVPAGSSFVSVNVTPAGQASGVLVRRFDA